MTPLRRARPLLGTLTEVGVLAHAADDARQALAAVEAAFAAIMAVEHAMSQQQPGSDVARLNRAAPGIPVPVAASTAAVLQAAKTLHAATAGAFDASCGTSRTGCGFDVRDGCAVRSAPAVRVSLDGIAKGHAVDRAVDALRAAGCTAGFVNAGGDLRAFGPHPLPVTLRIGRRTRIVTVTDAALATSDFARTRRTRGAAAQLRRRAPTWQGASVRAADCMLADALTKVALQPGGDACVARHGAALVWRA